MLGDLLKLLLAGEPTKEAEADAVEAAEGGGAKQRSKVSPLATLRKALDDARYDPVRSVLARSQEGAHAGFAFTPAPAESAAAGGGSGGVWEVVKPAAH